MHTIRMLAGCVGCLLAAGVALTGWNAPVMAQVVQPPMPLATGIVAGGSLAPMLESVIPTVVTIRVRGNKPVEIEIKPGMGVLAAKTEPFRAGGSGVIVDAARGYILTNNHVIEHATDIDVGLSTGRRLKAKLVGTDIGTDVAVIQVQPVNLPELTLGDSDGVRVGDLVVAVGNPFGLEGTATLGIISAKMRTQVGHGTFEDFLQTDSQINPGNSGGALVNLRGELIGINTVAGGGPGQNVGIGFAIPSNMALRIMHELIAAGRVRRGTTGLVVDDLPDDIVEQWGGLLKGAIVRKVLPQSPAAAAGVKPGSIVVSVMGNPVRDAAEFATRTVTVPLGMTIPMILFADGAGRPIALRSEDAVIEPDLTAIGKEAGTLAGAKVGDVLLGNPRFGDLRGAQIVALAEDAPARSAGLMVDDVIVRLDGRPVRSTEELAWRLSQASGKFRLSIDRNGQPAYLDVSK